MDKTPIYYIYLTDEEVDQKIQKLTQYQHTKFEEAMILTNNDKRHSLMLARTYPIDIFTKSS